MTRTENARARARARQIAETASRMLTLRVGSTEYLADWKDGYTLAMMPKLRECPAGAPIGFRSGYLQGTRAR